MTHVCAFFQVFLPSLPPKSSSQVFLPAGWPPASRASLLTPAEALTTGFHFKSTQASKNQILECKLCRYIAFLTYTVRDCISITIHCSCNHGKPRPLPARVMQSVLWYSYLTYTVRDCIPPAPLQFTACAIIVSRQPLPAYVASSTLYATCRKVWLMYHLSLQRNFTKYYFGYMQ